MVPLWHILLFWVLQDPGVSIVMHYKLYTFLHFFQNVIGFKYGKEKISNQHNIMIMLKNVQDWLTVGHHGFRDRSNLAMCFQTLTCTLT